MLSFSTVWKSIKLSWKVHFGVQIATLTVLVATFTVIISILSFSLNLHRILLHWGESVKVTAYIKDNLKAQEVSKIENALKEMHEVVGVSFVSKEQAHDVFAQEMAKYSPELLKDPEFSNPFPANFQMGIVESSMVDLEQIAKKINKIAGVEDVSYGQDWVDNYSNLVSAFSKSSWVIALVLLVGSFFVIGNSIRTSISYRRDEIEILELVGATQAMIRAPFVCDGALMGLFASAISIVVSFGFYRWGLKLFDTNLAFSALTSQFKYLNIGWFFAVLVFGALTGALGSYLCVREISLNQPHRSES